MPVIKTLHKLVSPVLYKTGLYEKIWQTRSRQNPFSFVVVYHRVVADSSDNRARFDIERGISATEFEKQMKFLVKHFTPVKASQVQLGINRGKTQFAVTLDDGYEDNYLVAAPILKKLGIPATFYVVSDFVGTDRLFWWEQVADMMHSSDQPELDLRKVMPDVSLLSGCENVLPLDSDSARDYAFGQLCSQVRKGLHEDIPLRIKQISEYFDEPVRELGRHYNLMKWQQLKNLVKQGFEVGGHTASHCNVIGADVTLLKHELVESINIIEKNIDAPVESFAYPYGLFKEADKEVSELLASTHCKAAFTGVQGVVNESLPRYELPRTRLNRSFPFACAFNVQDTLMNSRDN